MPTRRDPSGTKPPRKPGQSKRQRAIDPEKLRVVREMLIGTDYYEMQMVLAERWDVSPRTIRYYRQRVLELMRDELESENFLEPGMETVLALQQIDAARLRAIAAKDGRTEVACIKLRAQITGVMAPDRHLHLHPPAPAAPALPPPTNGMLPAPALDPVAQARRDMALRMAARIRGDVIDMKPAPPAGESGK